MTDQNLPAERGPAAMSLAHAADMQFGGPGGFDIAPRNLGEVVGFAKLMATADHAIPKHLRANPGACMAVTLQALSWEMSPFAVAQQTYKVGDTIAYMSQVITAVINTRAKLAKRPAIEFLGEGQSRQCKVTLTFRNGDERDYTSPQIKDIPIKNSPLWKGDPDQQLSYYSLRAAARRHCPEVILGVLDPDEVEYAQPLENQPPERREKVSLRSKLTDQTGRQGFDPDYVSSETGHDPATGEVIEGVATPAEEAEPEKAPEKPTKNITEAEAREELAAKLASLDKKPEPPAEVPLSAINEPVSGEPVVGQDGPDTIDSAEDLIRSTAFDDGFAGEPIEAVLVMCEDEAEQEIARVAYEEGRQAKIAREAEEHAKSEAAAAEAAALAAKAPEPSPELEDRAGPAPAGEKYFLASDEPGADGKLTLYVDGEVFSRVAATAASKYARYDGHPQPAEPALATQSGGTASQPEDAPAPETEAALPEAEAMKPNGLYAELAAKDSWLQIKPLLTRLYSSDQFKSLSVEEQAKTRAHLFGAVLEMKERKGDPVDWGQDPAAFALWLDHTFAGNDPDRANMIEGTFLTLQASRTYKERLTDAQRQGLELRVAGYLSSIKAAR